MTGFGDAQLERDDHAIVVEARAVNSRHLKLNVRLTEGYGALEARVESVVRQAIHRGSVYVNVRIRHIRAADDFRINVDVLEHYLDVLQKLAARRELPEEMRLEPLAQLPGVVEESSAEAHSADALWPLVEPVLRDALEMVARMRVAEGQALGDDLSRQTDAIEHCLGLIEQRAPTVVENYRSRLQQRVGDALSQLQVDVEPADLVREACLFADRVDISEEVVRLRSHLQQFRDACDSEESAGKRLEFICQEMGREINTIGSKANDAEISQQVIEIKTALERLREQVQNVE